MPVLVRAMERNGWSSGGRSSRRKKANFSASRYTSRSGSVNSWLVGRSTQESGKHFRSVGKEDLTGGLLKKVEEKDDAARCACR